MSTLVRQAMGGNKEAFIELMDMHKPVLLRIAHGYFAQEADVADAIQDTILDAYAHIASLKDPQYFKTWLVRILINNCNHIYRKNKKYVSLEEIAENFPDADDAFDSPLLRFHEILSCVSEENRICFQLFYGEELTTKEIADILHMKEGTIRSRMHREKIKLKAKLQRDGYSDLSGKEGKLS